MKTPDMKSQDKGIENAVFRCRFFKHATLLWTLRKWLFIKKRQYSVAPMPLRSPSSINRAIRLLSACSETAASVYAPETDRISFSFSAPKMTILDCFRHFRFRPKMISHFRFRFGFGSKVKFYFRRIFDFGAETEQVIYGRSLLCTRSGDHTTYKTVGVLQFHVLHFHVATLPCEVCGTMLTQRLTEEHHSAILPSHLPHDVTHYPITVHATKLQMYACSKF